MNVIAHAKLNLGLRVLAREESGYHQIETLFCALELGDELEVAALESGVELEVVTPPDRPGTLDLGPADDNLAVRAARAFGRRRGGGAHIRLTKRIPAAAGLGGGSSDAAAVLRALNRQHPEPLSEGELVELGGELGADVAFFVSGAGLALAWGRGDRLLALPPLPSAPVLLAIPPERVVTAEAYRALAQHRGERGVATAKLLSLPNTWNDVAAVAVNDFETVVFQQHPRLADLRDLMDAQGARIARMTGSGSVVFGLFDDLGAARAAADTLAREHSDVEPVLTRTIERLRDADA